MSGAAPLEIRNLVVAFGDRVVVDLARLRIADGEIVGLVGESGSGKSTTALAVLGLAETVGARVSGSIRLAGTEMVGASAPRRRELRGSQVAMIFQSPASAFSPVLPVGATVMRALRRHGAGRRRARARAAAAMREVLLPAATLDRYPHQLSGGQLQRVAIALALALGTRLLVADEPTSALDVTVQAEICALLAELRARDGLAVLLISHDLALVAEIADRVAVMRAGRVVEERPTRELVDDPRHPYTRELLAALPRLGGGGRA